MKVKHKVNTKKEDVIVITIKNKEDIKTLWHTFNISNKTIRSGTDDVFDDDIELNGSTFELFYIINDIAISEGMINENCE